MKKGIHPPSRPVVFQDVGADFKFLAMSSAEAKETTTWTDGNEYPLVLVDISSASHPYYTGKQKFVDTAGRVQKFAQRFNWSDDAAAKKSTQKSVTAKKAPKAAKKLPKKTKGKGGNRKTAPEEAQAAPAAAPESSAAPAQSTLPSDSPAPTAPETTNGTGGGDAASDTTPPATS